MTEPKPVYDLVPLPSDGAIAKLTSRMALFCRAYVAQGKRDAARAYREAGYTAKNDNVARVNACNLLHRSDIQAAIQEICRRDLVALAPVANKVAEELLQDKQMDPGVRARLLMAIWDRTGLGSTTEIKHTVEHIGNDPKAIGQIRTIIESLNLTDEQAEAFFGRTVARKVKVIDVEAVEITETDDQAPEPDSESADLSTPPGEAIEEDLSEEDVDRLLEEVKWVS